MLQEAFGQIKDDDGVSRFVAQFALTAIPQNSLSQVLGEWGGNSPEGHIHLKYRWYDSSSPFSVRPDIHVVELTVTPADGSPQWGLKRRFEE